MAYGQGEDKYNYYKDFDGISSNDDYAYGSSQFVSLEDIIDYFMVAYVGEDKIIKRIKKHEVNFHAKRNLAELSFDTFKSFHAQEMVLGASLSMPLPHDYVNYTKIAWSDDSGIEHIIYPTNKTSNPLSILQDADGGYGIKEKVSYTAGSTTATISSINKNIKNGMNYSSGFGSGIISNVLYTSTSTVLTLGSAAVSTGENTTKFYNNDFLYKQYNDPIVLTGVTIPALSNTITVSGSSGVKIGMLAYNDNLYEMEVVSVDGTSITLASTSSNTSEQTSQTVTFIEKNIDSSTWSKYKSNKPSENNINDYQDYENNVYWPNEGERYGLNPQHAQVNGSFYIDDVSGKIHFSSNLSGKTIVLKYLSSQGYGDLRVHKFAEEAIYKAIICDVMSSRANVPEYAIRRYKKEKFSSRRNAKLRLSNIKLEELIQVLRGKSKQIKH